MDGLALLHTVPACAARLRGRPLPPVLRWPALTRRASGSVSVSAVTRYPICLLLLSITAACEVLLPVDSASVSGYLLAWALTCSSSGVLLRRASAMVVPTRPRLVFCCYCWSPIHMYLHGRAQWGVYEHHLHAGPPLGGRGGRGGRPRAGTSPSCCRQAGRRAEEVEGEIMLIRRVAAEDGRRTWGSRRRSRSCHVNSRHA